MKDPKRKDPFSERYGAFSDRLQGDRWQPDVDVFETPTDLLVRADLAGVRSEDLRVTVDGPMLKISGVRRPSERGDLRRLHQMEIVSGPFERRVRIPVAFERENVTARLADGFLTVTLPKRLPVSQTVKVESP